MASRKPLFKDVGFQQKELAMTNPQLQSLKEEAVEVNIILCPPLPPPRVCTEGQVQGREGAQKTALPSSLTGEIVFLT